MADILIKGMEMPSFGNETIIRIQSGGGILDQYGHHLNCEAVPVPPHGRCIDADELYKEALKRSETKDGYYNCLDPVISCYTIDHAPTIIPSSKEGE